mmetsp:Transcript_14509/g.21984  ORF Transcript_14509/g.21984 Transcript_14509/m.21984 type:complete len:81 (-) Transcript_14509:810-1052(-)
MPSLLQHLYFDGGKLFFDKILAEEEQEGLNAFFRSLMCMLVESITLKQCGMDSLGWGWGCHGALEPQQITEISNGGGNLL